MKKKCFLILFLLFSLAVSSQDSENLKNLESKENLSVSNSSANLQNLFFDATKYAITGFSKNQEIKKIAEINLNQIKSLYSTKIARFNEKNRLVSFYAAEILVPERTGEIDCLYDENDLISYEETQIKYENYYDFAGDWIDQAILLSSMSGADEKNESQENVQNEDDEHDGQEILDLLEQGDNRGILEQDEKNEEKEKKEFSYADKNGVLRRFYYDGEGMSVDSYDENIYITRTYGKEIVRKRFDKNYRLASEEKLSFDENPKKITLKDLKTYNYNSDSTVPSSMKEERFSDKGKNDDILIETKFNEKGLAAEIKTGHWENLDDETEKGKKSKKSDDKNDKNDKNTTRKKFFDDRLESYLYDSQNRITEYELTTWSYKKNLLGRIVTESVKTKYEYSYHDEKSDEEANIPPDYKFYEDGVLRMERKYSAQDDFTEKLFFTDEIYVETVYQNGVKKLEIIYTNGKESRRREF